MENNSDVFTALKVLKGQQDQIDGDPSYVFSSLLAKLFKVNTIPFSLYSIDSLSPFYAEGFTEAEYFKTPCFRIENLDALSKKAVISLLKPFDVYGEIASDLSEIYLLKQTSIFLSIELTNFTSVKCLDIDLLKREIMIEPKW